MNGDGAIFFSPPGFPEFRAGALVVGAENGIDGLKLGRTGFCYGLDGVIQSGSLLMGANLIVT